MKYLLEERHGLCLKQRHQESPHGLHPAKPYGWAILLKAFGDHMSLSHAPDSGYGAMGFYICPAGFWACFGPIPFYSTISLFWNGNVYFVSKYVGSI